MLENTLRPEIIEGTGGSTAWLEDHRALYFRFVTLHAEICGVLKFHDESFQKVESRSGVKTDTSASCHAGSVPDPS